MYDICTLRVTSKTYTKDIAQTYKIYWDATVKKKTFGTKIARILVKESPFSLKNTWSLITLREAHEQYLQSDFNTE